MDKRLVIGLGVAFVLLLTIFAIMTSDDRIIDEENSLDHKPAHYTNNNVNNDDKLNTNDNEHSHSPVNNNNNNLNNNINNNIPFKSQRLFSSVYSFELLLLFLSFLLIFFIINIYYFIIIIFFLVYILFIYIFLEEYFFSFNNIVLFC